jgi:hypothetical protein
MSEERSDGWVTQSKKEYGEFFSELDVLLKALDRFFHIENLPISSGDLTGKNFFGELNAVRDVIFRILSILEIVIPENRKNAYWFQKFTESKYLSDHSRDLAKGKMYIQDTPEKGLCLMYDLFINLKSILTDLLKTGEISYLSYVNVGQLISKEIRANIYLNPFNREINPEFDSIANKGITEVVHAIKDSQVRKTVSLIYIYLFRFLRYIRHVNISSQLPVAMNSSLLILIMLRSEINMFHTFIKKVSGMTGDEELAMLLTSISYQFSMETKRVYIQELKDIIRKKGASHFRGKLENSQGILKNLIEQSIVQLTRFFNPNVQGKDIFGSFTTRHCQSIQLREDLFILHRFISLMEEKATFPEMVPDVLNSMKQFMHSFESSTFNLLRYDDYDEFVYFFKSIFSFQGTDLNKILKNIHGFKIFLETTLRNIANRPELSDAPVNINRVEEIVRQYR